jgi:ABC-type multidrug transport system fused ATPase/permease subunit
MSKTNKIKSLPTLLRWLWNMSSGYRTQSWLNIILGIFTVISDLTLVWCTKLTIDVATGDNKAFTLTQSLSFMGGIILLQVLMGIASRWIRALLGAKAQNSMQRTMFSHLLCVNWSAIRRFHTADLVNRLERDVRDVMSFVTENVPTFITVCLQFLGAFLFLFWMDSTLACIIVVLLPLFLLTSKLYVGRMRRISHKIRGSESKIQSVIQESLQHSLIIKSLGRIARMNDKLDETQAEFRKNVVHKTKYATISSGILNLGFATGYIVTFAWGVTSLYNGTITYGSLIAFVQLVGQIQSPVRTLTRFVPLFINTFTATERLIELQSLSQEHLGDTVSMQSPLGIRVNNLTYRYEGGNRIILDNFSCHFAPGSVNAIVGETGSGKTTLIRHLLALLTSTNGSVEIYDNTRSVEVSPQTRELFSYVPQGNTLLSGSIRENLYLGNPRATDEEINEVLHVAAADFVYELPDGVDTICGEMGFGLSEGQAQRIAIARALLKDSPILLLDEVTSSLDDVTEQLVLHRIINKYPSKTLLFITHRTEVLKHCDQVIKMARNK